MTESVRKQLWKLSHENYSNSKNYNNDVVVENNLTIVLENGGWWWHDMYQSHAHCTKQVGV